MMRPSSSRLALPVLAATLASGARTGLSELSEESCVLEALPSPPMQRPLAPYNLGVAVCIAGQLGRLEICSKVRNLMNPLLLAGIQVDVFVSVSTGSARFDDLGETQNCEKPLTEDFVKETLASVLTAYVFSDVEQENVSLDLWPSLYTDYDGCTHCTRRARHLANLLEMYRHWADCATLILRSEEERGGSYQSVIRVRDDTLVVRPVAPSIMTNLTAVKVKACMSWGGINDKLAFMPREHMEYVLCGPYIALKSHTVAAISNAVNSETLVKMAYESMRLPVEKVEMEDSWAAATIPMVKGECRGLLKSGENRWCITEQSEDCYPSETVSDLLFCQGGDPPGRLGYFGLPSSLFLSNQKTRGSLASRLASSSSAA
eukprot:TRINITY_DN42622_c0_g1_i1.p1 TRINITY_DN42622_c0_g1~~TRINITY_DN42622_c0_g1_i1.p1  ORF type:complete len:375 (-),score=43.40 TRINITY_DN42622_c0_g1_i1:115-1239(-)